jgi:phosphopantetheinyl transferase
MIPVPWKGEAVRVALLPVESVGGVASGAWLCADEAERFARLKHDRRRQEWLAARVCLKELLREQGLVQCATDGDLRADSFGRPVLYLRRASGWEESSVSCSVSHKGLYACAGVVWAEGMRIGVDVEEIGARPMRVRSAFVNPADATRSGAQPEVGYTVLWSVKESVSKAVGRGMVLGFERLVSRETEPGVFTTTVGDAVSFVSQVVRQGAYVVVVTVAPVAACHAAVCLGAEPRDAV